MSGQSIRDKAIKAEGDTALCSIGAHERGVHGHLLLRAIILVVFVPIVLLDRYGGEVGVQLKGEVSDAECHSRRRG